MLNKTDFIELMTKQEQLDAEIRESKGISPTEWRTFDRQHRIALSTEVHEFINEYRTLGHKVVWKYWSGKQTIPERLLDEAVDVVHFGCLILNKWAVNNGLNTERAADELYPLYLSNYEGSLNKDPLDNLDHLASHSTNVHTVLPVLMAVLNITGVNREDVLKQYDVKQEVNYTRQTEGY